MKTRQQRQEAAMPRRAYSYRRVSDPSQLAGDGLRRQDDYAQQLCQKHGWTLDDTRVFCDEGKSAFHGRNLGPTAALTRFLDLVRRGQISAGSVLIVENVDRLSRQDVDLAYDIFREIIKAGVWIATRTPERVYRRDNVGLMDLMEPLWLMYLAHMESAKKSERVGAAWQQARKRAREEKVAHHRPPCWARRGPDGWEPIPERVALIRRVVEMTCGGLSARDIVGRMTAEGVPWPGRLWDGKPVGWSGSTLQWLLRSRVLVGEYQPRRRVNGKWEPDGEPIAGYYPPALREEEWQRLQAAIDTRRRKSGRRGKRNRNLFVGLARDAVSRRPLAMQSHVHEGRQGQYLVQYLIIAGRPGGLTVRYDRFEAGVLDAIALLRPEDVLDPEARRDVREHRVAELTARVTALSQRKERLQRQLADTGQDPEPILPVLDAVSADLKAAAQERDRLQLETRSGRAEALREAQTLNQLRASATGEERAELDRRIKAALPSVVSEIWCQGQDVGGQARVIHVQIYLRSGACRYIQILPVARGGKVRHEVDLSGIKVWQLEGWDLRRGPYAPAEVGDGAALPETA